ncbi:MAG TPA: hypothetical protein VGK40_02690 [Verrucomicrobiae bacterium]|jgi:hypothetical protein
MSSPKYEPVQLELMGRKENFDVIEAPENVPNLLGQVPLEVLDFVVDSKGQKLIPNPAHGGEQMTEEYFSLECDEKRWPAPAPTCLCSATRDSPMRLRLPLPQIEASLR